MADRVGQQLGNYQLIRPLGEGGFAEVYLGEHIHLGSQAAIKVLHSQLTSDDVDKFRMEARNLVRLVHPHIVRVLEFGIEGKTPFLVMDYAPNGTLRNRHPKGTILPITTIVAYVKQIADALQFAHDEKLIHRDVKPENMLLGRRNEILLSDFGIAIVAQSSRYQNAQDMAGTIAYMAPEQIQAHPRSASDQYSLAIVVYEWLTGDRPFHGSFTEIAIKHSVVPPPPLREKVPTILPDVEQVVMMALAKEPKERFGSVQAFANALEQASQGEMATFVKPSAPMLASMVQPIPTPRVVHSSTSASITPPTPSRGSSTRSTPLASNPPAPASPPLSSPSSLPGGPVAVPTRSARTFKIRYILGIVLYLVSADVLGLLERNILLQNRLEGQLAQFTLFGNKITIYVSTIVFIVTLIAILLILVRLDLLPRLGLLQRGFAATKKRSTSRPKKR